eukprot:scaffold16254_cov69-Phaeocystis_antarctica.AAC.2
MGPKPQTPRRSKQDGASSQRPVPRRGSCVGRLTRCSALGSVAAALLAYFAGALLPTPPKPTDPDVAVLDSRTVRRLPALNTGAVPCTGAAVSAPRVTERPPLPGARQLPARSRHALLEALHRQVRRQPEHAVHVERPAAGRPATPQPDVVAREGGRGRAARARAAARRVLLLHHFRTLHATPRQAAPALQLAGRFGQQRPPLTLTPTPTPTRTSTPTLTLTLT